MLKNSLKNKFLLIFFIFSLTLILGGFHFFQNSLKSQEKNKSYIEEKEAITDLYRRRDSIKSLLLVDDYLNFIQEEKRLKIKNPDIELNKKYLFKEMKELKILENIILSLHKEYLRINLEFLDTYKKEKSVRHNIRDRIYKNADSNETMALGEVIYESKEAIFQYKDKEHLDEWINSIDTLQKISTDPSLLIDIKKYHQISIIITDLLLSQNAILEETEENMGNYNKILNIMDEKVNLMKSDIDKSIEKTNEAIHHKLIISLIIMVSFFIVLGFFIHSQLIKPLDVLKQSTKELANNNFDHKIEINKNDEMGELAKDFNIMINNLKSTYWNLEEIVKQRTIKLENSNSHLLKEIAEREKLEKKLKTQATTDELTGLYNRRAAYIFLSDEIKRLKIQGFGMTVCYMDIDDFKKINDNLGHEEGDRCLIGFSKVLKLSLRQEDYIFRMGGDEFIAAFPNQDKEDVEIFFKNRILPELRSKLNIECSYGIIEFSNETEMSLDEIIKKSDENMYKNKSEKKQKASMSLNPSFA